MGSKLPGAAPAGCDPCLVPPLADGMLVSTQRVENSSSTLTQEFVSHTVMASGTLTQHVERQFYEA